jgi:hypothetical protein
MHRLITQGPDLVLRALDDFHQLVRVLQKMEDVGRISKDIRDLERRLASTEAVLRDLAKPARTTDTIMRAMPGSKVVAARAKAQKDRARAAREQKPARPKSDPA